MDTPTTTPATEATALDLSGVVRSRDAGSTRLRLLQAARRRFARDGYTGTTVREIAADAGVNVSLINRYFTSKEGLFEACLQRVVEDLDSPRGTSVTVERLLSTMIEQLTDVPNEEHPLHLLLLLRSSGDDRADQIRRDTLRRFAEGMAAAAGWRAGDADEESMLLRAQVALAAALGVLLLRSSTGLEPLTSATADELRRPLGDLMATLLSDS